MKKNTTNLAKKPLNRGVYTSLIILLSIFITCFIAGFLLLTIYSIALTVATLSAMVFFIVFGSATLSLAFGILLLWALFALQQKYGNMYFGFAKNSAKLEHNNITQKNDETTKKDSQKDKHKISEFFQTVALISIIVAVIFVAISAVLGSTSRDTWKKDFASFRQINGYLNSNQETETVYDSNCEKIILNLDTKFAVVIYDDRIDDISILYTREFESQLTIVQSEHFLTVVENPPPTLDNPLANMLFFVFISSKNAQQLKILIPESLKDLVIIDGEHILTQD